MPFCKGINKLSEHEVVERFFKQGLELLEPSTYQTTRYPCRVKCSGCSLSFDVSLQYAEQSKGTGCYLHKCKRKPTVGSKHNRWTGYQNVSGTYWNHFVGQAKMNNRLIFFDIKYLDYLYENQFRRCILSGVPISFGDGYHRNNVTVSVDRIDSSIYNYTVDNVQLIHKVVQYMKQNYSIDEFVSWCRLITHKADSINDQTKA